jgi:hypothetical protein
MNVFAWKTVSLKECCAAFNEDCSLRAKRPSSKDSCPFQGIPHFLKEVVCGRADLSKELCSIDGRLDILEICNESCTF